MISRTTLMTAILFAPASLSSTLNSVFSSAAAAGAAAAAAGPGGDGDGGRLDAPLVLEGLDEVRELDDRQVRKVVDDLLTRDVCHDEFSVIEI